MFWGKKKDNDAELKNKMIRDLRSSFPSLRRPNNDDTVFEIMFELNRQYHTLRVYLSPDFPASRPILQVVGDVKHPWLDSYKRVSGSNMLLNWSKASSLADTVIDTLSALQNTKNQSSIQQRASVDSTTSSASQSSQQWERDRSSSLGYSQHPGLAQQQHLGYGNQAPAPAPAAGGMAAYYSQQQQQQQHAPHHHAPPNGYHHAPPTYGVHSHQQQPTPAYGGRPSPPIPQQQVDPPPPAYEDATGAGRSSPPAPPPKPSKRQVPKTDIPPIPSTFEELDSMTDLQLEKLLNDEVALKAHVRGHSMVEFMTEPLEQLRLSNKNDAVALLEMKDALVKQREETLAAQTELREAVNKYRERAAQMSVRYTVKRADVIAESQAKRDQLDLASEELAEKFTNGEKDVTSFLSEYMQMRTDYHALNIKLVCIDRDKS